MRYVPADTGLSASGMYPDDWAAFGRAIAAAPLGLGGDIRDQRSAQDLRRRRGAAGAVPKRKCGQREALAVRGKDCCQSLLGITASDVLTALDSELTGLAQRLRPGPVLHQMLDLPQDLDVVKVEPHRSRKEPKNYEYMRLE